MKRSELRAGQQVKYCTGDVEYTVIHAPREGRGFWLMAKHNNARYPITNVHALELIAQPVIEPTEFRRIKDRLTYSIKPNKIHKGENKMSININSTVAKVFTDVETAALVTRHLGQEYPENNHRALLDLKRNRVEVLKEAKRLEGLEKQEIE